MKFTVILGLCLSLVGCSHLTTPGDTPGRQAGTVAIKGVSDQLDVASPGQSIWLRSSGSVSSATGCHLHYRLYLPLDMSSEASIRSLVVLGHGFLRSQEHMRDLATAIARSGVPVATLDFCNTRLWDGRHFRNGLDMIRVADALEAERRIYAGFSAGALAALVAAHVDSNSLGIVGLDLVDAQGLGKRLAASLRRPIFGVFGDPSRDRKSVV